MNNSKRKAKSLKHCLYEKVTIQLTWKSFYISNCKMSLSKAFWNSYLKLLYNDFSCWHVPISYLCLGRRPGLVLFYFFLKSAATIRMIVQWISHVNSLLGLGEGNNIYSSGSFLLFPTILVSFIPSDLC